MAGYIQYPFPLFGLFPTPFPLLVSFCWFVFAYFCVVSSLLPFIFPCYIFFFIFLSLLLFVCLYLLRSLGLGGGPLALGSGGALTAPARAHPHPCTTRAMLQNNNNIMCELFISSTKLFICYFSIGIRNDCFYGLRTLILYNLLHCLQLILWPTSLCLLSCSDNFVPKFTYTLIIAPIFLMHFRFPFQLFRLESSTFDVIFCFHSLESPPKKRLINSFNVHCGRRT